MDIDESKLTALIERVVRELAPTRQSGTRPQNGEGVFEKMDDAVRAAADAQRAYMDCQLADRRRFVAAIREVALKPENLEHMAKATVEETGMGRVDDKIQKNRLAAEGTPGVEDLITEAWSGDDGLTTVEYSPFGVIGAITPTTNPTETVICNAIGMLAAGNSVVFSPHPRAKKISLWLIREINHALAAAGAPPNLVVSVAEPSLEQTTTLLEHPLVQMLVSTGGPAIVRKVMATGKKAIGAGAGNPPVVVDASADLVQAARCIVDGASFDNNLPCTAEKELIAVDSIADLLLFEMAKVGAHEVKDSEQIKRLESLLLDERDQPRPEWIGKDATAILAAADIPHTSEVRLVVVQTEKQHPFVQHELMMPVLPLVRVANVDAAIELAVEVEHGNRHTAVMHSQDVSQLTKMGRLIQTTVYVKNGPSYAGLGIGGEGFTTFTIAGPTGEGLTSARSFARSRRCVLVGDFNIR